MSLFVITISAIMGSFANMLAYRLPRQLPIGVERSRCPQCNTPLRVYELIPVISYIHLLGRCRFCKRPIPLRYLLLEIGCIVGGLLLYTALHHTPLALLFWAIISFIGLLIFVIDMETQLIPNSLTFILGTTGIIAHCVLGTGITAITAALLSGLTMWTLATFTEKLYRRPTFGGGDTKLMAALGGVIGLSSALWSLYIGFLLAAVFCIPLLLLGRRNRTDMIAFGPFIILGAALVTLNCAIRVFPLPFWDPSHSFPVFKRTMNDRL
jgi:leader peptidase (prepilin peptidase)/N-methyltransferase